MPCTMTLKSRQRRMVDWFNLPLNKYIGIGRTTAWTDDTDPDLPDETATELENLIGVQLITGQKYAKEIPDDELTTEKKLEGKFYKGQYYEVTSDKEYALSHGFTAVMLWTTLDRDTYFPVDVTYRQVGLFVKVNSNAVYMNGTDFNAMLSDYRGTLELIDNRKPQTRQNDQQEELTILVDF